MSLKDTFRRLATTPLAVCKSCRRALTTPARRQQGSSNPITELMNIPRSSSAASRTPQLLRPARTAPLASPAPSTGAAAPSNPRTSSFDLATTTIQESAAASRRHQERSQAIANLEKSSTRKDLEAQISRRWKVGDVYAPHDLSGVEMSKWKKLRKRPRGGKDALDLLGINPVVHYKNFAMMSEYMTEMGRIKHSSETGLRPVNQRRMAKALRRAIGLGLMPSVHRHPEILRMEIEEKTRRF